VRIGIDYTSAVRQGGGIGRYTRNLIRSLADLDSDNEYRLFVAGGWGEGDGLGAWPARFAVRAVPLSDRALHILWQRLRLPVPVQAVTGRLDLFHSPDFVLPPTGSTPSVLTVHDLSFLRVPECFVPGFCEYLMDAVSRAVRRAEHILADSQSTCKDLVELMGVDRERVTVLYPGVEARFKPVRDPAILARIRRRYRLPDRFVLGLGTLQPRKNFSGLIRAFGQLLSSGVAGAEAADLRLVIAGGEGWMYEDTLLLADRLGFGDRVVFTGFVDDADLPVLYNLATLFAFPSWYEGFGLPVLEAMACGTPVISANNSSLPEVVGEAGLLVDAADADGLVGALARTLTDPELRARLVAAGLAQAKRFSWGASARQLLELYRATMAGH
jgi:glycosyltransferase involved in cell wall biosynthesis